MQKSSLNLSHIKFDLLKISEIYDGVLTETLSHLPIRLYEQYLADLVRDQLIHQFRIDEPELRENSDSGVKSFTYTFHIQGNPDRTFKVLKIHVGLYKSLKEPLAFETVHRADGSCCFADRKAS